MDIEIFCILLHIILLPFSYIRLKIKKNSGKNPYPILLIPGLFENQTDWWIHRYLLHRQGMDKIYLLNLASPFANIGKHAQYVYTEIQRIKAESRADKVILIGHSRGGLVASYCAEALCKNNEIDKIITLGSPFRGSHLAKYFNIHNIKQMQYDSEFLNTLKKLTKNTSIPYYCISSTLDSLVYPTTSAKAYIDNPLLIHAIIMDNIGHLGFLKSFKVHQQLKQKIS